MDDILEYIIFNVLRFYVDGTVLLCDSKNRLKSSKFNLTFLTFNENSDILRFFLRKKSYLYFENNAIFRISVEVIRFQNNI